MKYFYAALITLGAAAIIYMLAGFIIFARLFFSPGKKLSAREIYKYKIGPMGMDEDEKIVSSFKSESVGIYSNDGLELKAQLYLPDEKPCERSVILFHGRRSRASLDFPRLIRFFIMQGFNVLCPDMRGCGSSAGRFCSLGPLESFDCISWCGYLEMRFGTQHPVLLHGFDAGAFAAFAAGANPDLPKNAAGIACEGIYESVYKKAYVKINSAAGFLTGFLIQPVNFFYKLFASLDMRAFSLSSAAGRIKLPVFIVSLKNDPFISEDELKNITKSLARGEAVTCVNLPRRPLLFSFTESPDAEYILFLKSVFKGFKENSDYEFDFSDGEESEE